MRYSLGQRQTAEEELQNYDQGYFLRKKGKYTSAPWCVGIGRVAAMAMAFCCTANYDYPRTVVDFCKHLESYGIFINPNDIPKIDLGNTLRNLGLIIDSPDAEGGIVIVSPFLNAG